MRIAVPLLKASVIATIVFAIAWIRIPFTASNLTVVLSTFVGYGIVIVILSMTLGYLLASIAARLRIVRWWLCTGVSAAIGASLGGFFTYHPTPSGNLSSTAN